MSLINCEISFMLNCSEKSFLIAYTVENQVPTFTITYTKSYVPVVTLSTQDNVKLLEQLKPVLKEQLTGININLTKQHRHKSNI